MLVLALVPAAQAQAHGVSATADLQLAQTFAGNELTVVIRRTPEVPGPLLVDVIAHAPVRARSLELGVRSVELGALSAGEIALSDAGIQSAQLRVTAAGIHELTLRTGSEQALIPFRVLVPKPAGWEFFIYGAFGVAGLLILTGIASTTIGVLRPFAVPQALLVLVALVAASTTAMLSKDLPPSTPEGAPEVGSARGDPTDGSAPGGRPYANLTLRTEPAKPVTGKPVTITLLLTDGNTGRPVDDLVAHHAALLHTVITGEAGKDFHHVHPVRTGPGLYRLQLTMRSPGRHLLYAEFERADSGAQLVTGSFVVDRAPTGQPRRAAAARRGTGPALSAPEYGTGSIQLSPGKPVAGRPVTIAAHVTADGRPATDLQPWLGMAGHLIVRDPESAFFGHVHELTSMAAQSRSPDQPPPDETVAAEGPELRFTFTFPAAGRYLVWIQYARGFRIYTVPTTVTVSKGQP